MGTIQIDGSTPKLTIGNATAEDALILFDGNAQDFHIGLDDTADDLVIGVGSALGTTTALAIDENAGSTFSGTVTVGVDDTGKDVKLFGATSGSFLLWDESADALLLTDSTPIKIGDTQDLTLYHDGTNSYITNAVGALKVATETSGIAVTIGHTTSETTVADNLTVTGTATITGGQIVFPGTQVGSAGANTLDDYEEGTWTPSMFGGATMTAGTVNGYYTKIGRMVFCNGVYVSSDLNGASGAIRLRGLPFTSSSTGNAYSSGTPSYAVGLNITAGHTFTIRTELGSTECYLALFDVTTGSSSMQASEWSDDGEMRFDFKYMV